MARSPFEGATGIKYLVHVQSTFERFSVGASTEDKHMNQDQFQRFCEEMGLVNQEMSRRLFLAMDDDNTGAMEAYEFLAGIRKMCGRTEADGTADWRPPVHDVDLGRDAFPAPCDGAVNQKVPAYPSQNQSLPSLISMRSCAQSKT